MFKTGEIFLLGGNLLNWLPKIKWSALKTYIHKELYIHLTGCLFIFRNMRVCVHTHTYTCSKAAMIEGIEFVNLRENKIFYFNWKREIMDLNITFPFGEEIVFSSHAHVVGWKSEVRQTAYYRKYTPGHFFQTAHAAFSLKPLISNWFAERKSWCSHMNQRTQVHLPELTRCCFWCHPGLPTILCRYCSSLWPKIEIYLQRWGKRRQEE